MILGALTKGDYALLISIASLGVALGSLSWSVYLALRVDRATLELTLEDQTIIAGQRQDPVVRISVVNVGKRATTLESLWLAFGRPVRRWHWFIPKPMRRGKKALLIPDTKHASISTRLPTLLDVGARASIYYDRAVVVGQAKEHGQKRMYATAGASTMSANSRVHRVKSLSD